jgi:hypothetical protein
MAFAKIKCPVCNELTVEYTMCDKSTKSVSYIHDDGTEHTKINEVVVDEVQSTNI